MNDDLEERMLRRYINEAKVNVAGKWLHEVVKAGILTTDELCALARVMEKHSNRPQPIAFTDPYGIGDRP